MILGDIKKAKEQLEEIMLGPYTASKGRLHMNMPYSLGPGNKDCPVNGNDSAAPVGSFRGLFIFTFSCRPAAH